MSFKQRTTKPSAGNKYYIRKVNGGWSPCIQGSPVDSECNVLSNCVGYAIGRFNEIGEWGSCKYLASVNAENFIQYKGSELEVGQAPRLGACMVWQKGATLGEADGAGHVAIVEKVVSDTEVFTSESAYGGAAFKNVTRKKGSDGKWGMGSGYKFLGFIYNPAECCHETVASSAATAGFKVGDVVDFKGGYHYGSSTSTKAVGDKRTAGKAKVTAVAKNANHPLHLVGESGGSDVFGWVDAADVESVNTPKPAAVADLKIGMVVNFKGGYHYVSSTATNATGGKRSAGKAKISNLAQGTRHPVSLVGEKGESDVYGWVDIADVEVI